MTSSTRSKHIAPAVHCLSLHRFGVAYADRAILAEVDLGVPARGVVVLMGPGGAGKSTLLRTIAGFNRHMPMLATWGEARYRGEPLGAGNYPVLVSQKTQLLTSTLLENLLYETREQFSATPEEKRARALATLQAVRLERFVNCLSEPVVSLPLAAQRLIAIARAVASAPALVLIDEPTFGLDATDAQAVLDVIRKQADERAVLVVLHNQAQVHAFSRLRPPPARRQVASASMGARGFVWLLDGKLAGTPQPGVVADIRGDLQALRRVGVSHLISLTEAPLDGATLDEHGICAHWFPIPDMQAPAMIGVGRTVTHPTPDLDQYYASLARRGLMLPVFEVDVRRSEDVLMLLDMLFGTLEAASAQ